MTATTPGFYRYPVMPPSMEEEAADAIGHLYECDDCARLMHFDRDPAVIAEADQYPCPPADPEAGGYDHGYADAQAVAVDYLLGELAATRRKQNARAGIVGSRAQALFTREAGVLTNALTAITGHFRPWIDEQLTARESE